LKALVASIVASAALGVGALAINSGDLGDFEGRVIGTALLVSACSCVLLPLVLAIEAKRFPFLPSFATSGALCAVAGFGLVIFGIWAEMDSDSFWRTTGTLIIIAFGAAHLCLLSLARLTAPRANLQLVATAMTVVLVFELISAVWNEEVGDNFWRILAITTILTAAASILVPILQRTSPVAPTNSSALGFCPRCGSEALYSGSSGSCESCGAAFRVELLPDGVVSDPPQR
jgi:hypothetical protein